MHGRVWQGQDLGQVCATSCPMQGLGAASELSQPRQLLSDMNFPPAQDDAAPPSSSHPPLPRHPLPLRGARRCPALGQWLSLRVLLPFSSLLTLCTCLIPLYLPGPPSRATQLFIGPLLSKRCLCLAKWGLLLQAAGVNRTSPAPSVPCSSFWGLPFTSWHSPSSSSSFLMPSDGQGGMCGSGSSRRCPLPPKLPLAMPKDPVPVPVPPPPPLHPSRFRPSPLVSLAKP